MKKIIFVLLIFCTVSLYAQDTLDSNKIFKEYNVSLKLTKEQQAQFVLILEKYKSELYNKDIAIKNFNKTNKMRDLEFYKLLSQEQFNKYKKAKLKIEASLKFRFN